MKELTESLVIALKAKLITKTQAREMFTKAVSYWFDGPEHTHGEEDIDERN